MTKKIIYAMFLVLAIGLTQGQAQGAYRVAYWDGNYPDHWIGAADAAAARDALEAAGYEILDADQLKTFMDARIADGVTSVVVLCKDVFPETVAETNTADCTVRQYLDAGGKIVFYGDIPFYNQGNPGGGETNWGNGGAQGILGFNAAGGTWDSSNTVTITEAGEEWGLTETWASVRPANPSEVDTIRAADNAGNAAAWVKHFVPGDIYGGFVRIWDRGNVYSFEDLMRVAEYGLGGNPYPRGPNPKDGALHEDTWVSTSWYAGDFAVSHDVYFSDNLDDVQAGAESTFIGNQGMTNLVAGFPGFPYPEGLVPGTTYYWKVVEVNEADPNSPWEGPVWSFTIPPRTAYNPVPADGAKFVDPDADLSWTPGFSGKLHTVYFGDSFDDVNNATVGALQGTTTYALDTLEPEKTYYWRVDEFDAISTRKGNIWSFTTAGEGGGIKGEYFNNMDLSGTPALTRIDPQINFYWNPGPNPPPGINEDGFSVRWTGELEAPFSEPTTFITGSDDGVRMYLDGTLIINDWADHDRTETRSEPIELIEGHTYGIVVEGYENAGEAEWQLYWLSPSMPRQLVPQAALSPPIRASSPKPSNGAVDVSQISTLSWSPGDAAVSHQIYFGTDMDAVTNADTSSPEYKGSRDLGSESYDPGKLEWDVTYYWRVDEVEDGGTIQKGNVWSFTTANFLIVDDMESYNDINEGEPGSNRIYLAWIDGFDNPAVNGSTVGHLDPPFAEQTIVHSGNQSMPFTYNNGVGKSEATLTLTYPRDWTENGVDTLAIWYIGDAANDPETMYVVLNGTSGVDNPDQNAAQVEEWTEWRISLQQFNVNLTNVNTITIGFGNRTNPVAGGSGMMYFDDIRLLLPAP
jgi:hypothetical protein